MTKDAGAEIVDLYVAQELRMARLYTLYADRYPDHIGFWTSLAEQERRHAAAIRNLWNRTRSGGANFNPGRFRSGILRMFIGYLDKVYAKAKAERAPLLGALAVARDIENAMIEKKALGIFEGDAPEVQRLLERLHKDTARHAAQLDLMWRREKGAA